MFQRTGILYIALILLVASGLPARIPAADPVQPNVLFISVDDLNDWIGCMGGNKQSISPNLDRLAASGVLFTNAHCPGAACNPSRTSRLRLLRDALAPKRGPDTGQGVHRWHGMFWAVAAG